MITDLPSIAKQTSETGQPRRQIRIAYVVNSFAMGGLERSIARLVNGMDRDRFAPVVICLSNETSAAGWIDDQSTPVLTLNKKSGNDFAIVRRLADTLCQRSIDLVHSHNWGTLIETTLARRMSRVPIHVHAERGTVGGSIVGKGFRQYMRAQAMRWAMNRADAVISNAISVGERVEARCSYPANRIHVISNGMESLRLADHDAARETVRSALGITSETVLIGSVGRLNSVKAFELAVEAISMLPKSPVAHLVLVGDGGELSFLQGRAATLSVLERVHFAGKQEDVGRWLAAMDIYINTSLSEGMSQSIVEAMSVGLPLVVTDVGDNGLLATGPPGCGIVVDSGSASQLANALQCLIANPAQRTKLGRSALASFHASYEFQRMIDDYQAFYDGLVAHGQQHPCR